MRLRYRRILTLKYAVGAICILFALNFLINMKWIHELAFRTHPDTQRIRGVHFSMASFYVPDENQKFICIVDREIIAFDKVNDDYCDCNDGSDEPGTAACPNGIFYCDSDINRRHAKPFPAGRVNDGICDCCDGSDEWQKSEFSSVLSGSHQTGCPYRC